MSNELVLSIRPATEADAEAVVAIAIAEWEAIYQGYRAQLGDEIFYRFFPDHKAQKANNVRGNLASGTMYVTECDGRIAGFIHYVYDAKAASVRSQTMPFRANFVAWVSARANTSSFSACSASRVRSVSV